MSNLRVNDANIFFIFGDKRANIYNIKMSGLTIGIIIVVVILIIIAIGVAIYFLWPSTETLAIVPVKFTKRGQERGHGPGYRYRV